MHFSAKSLRIAIAVLFAAGPFAESLSLQRLGNYEILKRRAALVPRDDYKSVVTSTFTGTALFANLPRAPAGVRPRPRPHDDAGDPDINPNKPDASTGKSEDGSSNFSERIDEEDSSDADSNEGVLVDSDGDENIPDPAALTKKLQAKGELELSRFDAIPGNTVDKKWKVEEPFVDQGPGYGFTSENGGTVASGGQFETSGAMFDFLGISKDLKLQRVKVVARDQGTDDKIVLDNYFGDGVIIAANNNMQGRNIAPVGKKVDHWSELLWHSADRFYGKEKKPDFKYVLRDAINNGQSKAVIDTVHANPDPIVKKLIQGEFGAFDPYSPDAAERAVAAPLIGTPNGKGVLFLLSDYPESLGRKRINKVYTYRKPEEANSQWGMAFEMGLAPTKETERR